MTTKISKNLIVDNFVALAGDIMSGNLAIDSTSPELKLQADAGAISTIKLLEDGTGDVGFKIEYDGATNELIVAGGNNGYTDYITVNRDTGVTELAGDLTILKASPQVTLARSLDAQNALCRFGNSSDGLTGSGYVGALASSSAIRLNSYHGSVHLSAEDGTGLLTFNAAGQVSATGTAAAPTAVSHLTRKDYVDDNFLADSVFVTSGTEGTDSTKWTKFSRVTIPSQYQYSDSTINLIEAKSGSTAIAQHRLYIRTKQQYAFGIDPDVDLVLTSDDGTEGPTPPKVGYIIVQNTPTTIVDFYIQVNGSYSSYHGTKVSAHYADTHTEWFSNQVWFASPGAVETALDIIPNEVSTAVIASKARNVIINGNMDVWQRGTSFSSIPTDTFTADRFDYAKSGTMVHTVGRSVLSPTYAQAGAVSNYSLLAQITTADTSIVDGDYSFLGYKVEGYDYRRIAGGDATLSFWVYAENKIGTHCVSFRNTGGDRSYIVEYTINAANTWEKKTITVPLTETGGTWDYINGSGLLIGFALAAGATFQTTKDAWQTGNYLATSAQVNACDSTANRFRITQVQLEKGSTATPFELKLYSDELARCQRYFSTSYTGGVTLGAISGLGQIVELATRNTADVTHGTPFPVAMRGIPAITLYAPSTGNSAKVTNSGDKTATAVNIGTSGIGNINITSGVLSSNCTWHYGADAEL